MWRKLARLRSNVQNIGKSPRVADESMFGGMNGAEFPILPQVNGADGLWVT
ncbi:hypothetical protein OIU84_016771, partial [Salix udensis]